MQETFGPYRLEALLGRGGMGEVFRATDTRKKDRLVALKRMPADFTDPEFEERFRREAHAAAGLRSPHIIPIHDYGEIDGRLFLDMALVEGRDLARVLADAGPLSPQRAIGVVAQTASALDTAHRAGLIHRDVKPSNILLVDSDIDEDADFVYLVDFGIARDTASTGLTSTGLTVGTMTYMAPERFVDPRRSDARVDVYALGCVLYEALTGRPPFPGDDVPHLMYCHLSAPPPAPSRARPDLPTELDDVIARAMAKDPGDRYATAGELARHGRRVLTAGPTPESARPTSVGPPSGERPPASGPVRPPSPPPTAVPSRPVSSGGDEPARRRPGSTAAAIADAAVLVALLVPLLNSVFTVLTYSDQVTDYVALWVASTTGLVLAGLLRAAGASRSWRSVGIAAVGGRLGGALVVDVRGGLVLVAGVVLLVTVLVSCVLALVARGGDRRLAMAGDITAAAMVSVTAAVTFPLLPAGYSVVPVVVGLVVGLLVGVLRMFPARAVLPVALLAPAALGAVGVYLSRIDYFVERFPEASTPVVVQNVVISLPAAVSVAAVVVFAFRARRVVAETPMTRVVTASP
ncbi:serine/threonine-protein kinase [Actinomycetospora sp. CA-101289]|uniref:serine/threonine-protein kinase n=1 Tax=Actinomycetospora sp. CA-101289 TaxID=3239893 RepID=UPI003D98CFA2